MSADSDIADDMVGGVWVSTISLRYDYSFDDGAPILFETMVFGGEHDQHRERYTNPIAALAGHDRVMAMVRDALAG